MQIVAVFEFVGVRNVFQTMIKSIAVSCVFLNQCSAISQDPSKQLPSSPASAAKLDTQSVAIREQLARVQASFDQSNAPKWSRIAFVGAVTEIRPRKATDRLIGGLEDNATEVAVIKIHLIGRSNQFGLRETGIIVCPVGKSREPWKSWHEQKSELIFEYSRIANREFVFKFGC